MPPKKGPSKTTENKAKAKAVEDKTFGLKNKNKSTKVAKYVAQVQQQVSQSGNRKQKEEDEKRKKALQDKKALEEQKKKELQELFKPVQQQQKVPFGVDPKTIVCAFYKSGGCDKGSKCKFSHDLALERKSAKADVYTDGRDKDTMEQWDQQKLETVVNQKHSQDSTNLNKPTEIVCKYFLDAIESGKYGWFWECPNGGAKCKYRHALPPGFVLKKKETPEERRAREEAEKENQITIEEFLETERHNLGTNLTPITEETFKAWKEAKKKSQEEAMTKQRQEKEQAFKRNAKGQSFSGRELFEFNPELAKGGDDEDDALDAQDYADRSEDEGEIPDGSMKAPTFEDENQDAERRKIDEDLFAEEELEGLSDDSDDEVESLTEKMDTASVQ